MHREARESPRQCRGPYADGRRVVPDRGSATSATSACRTYVREGGIIGYRCASEPVPIYVRKGDALEDTIGRKCLCNALTANVGIGQTRRSGYTELPLVTLGSDLAGVRALLREHRQGWTAGEAVAWLTAAVPARAG